ncbi:hypothetical protein [Legionella lytica]|nr:hypothetical protein [Legionella lytica]
MNERKEQQLAADSFGVGKSIVMGTAGAHQHLVSLQPSHHL